MPVPEEPVPEEPVPGPLVAWADEPVPGGLVGATEGALPDWVLSADGEAFTDPVLFADEWLALEVVAPELVLPEAALAVAEPDCPARVCEVALTAELAAEPTSESAEDGDEPGGGGESAAACACRENTSMMRKIPAATIVSCTARRAMRRAIGCGMSCSHRRGS